jgi:antitoxin component YwqK of YwqJK toxin-antitoxin module
MRIVLLVGLAFLFQSCFTADVSGKYYNISEDKEGVTHYVDFKEDGTFFHYYKKDTVVRSHTGKWEKTDKNDCIELYPWVVYGKAEQKNLEDFNVTFGTQIGNMFFWQYGKYLNNNPDGTDACSFIDDRFVEEVKKEILEEEAEWNRKDTLRYDTGEISGIGKLSYKKKHRVWKEYYKSGNIKATGEYKYDKEIGLWKYYYETGKLKELGTYEGISKNGLWEYYHENGKLKEMGIYIYNLNNKIEKRGDWKIYDNNGKLIKTEKFPTRDKYYDSLYMAPPYDYNKCDAVQKRNERIKILDKDYNDYKASLTIRK